MELITAMDRQDVDLTDLLWGVLKKVESFAQLRQAWEFVFETIKQEEIRPYVSIHFLYFGPFENND